ncbi:MAG: DUF2459 domain-containing protein [Cyclobacteriaceae bacterium]|nr:DUF2459 domain-containing protein [Cyclobacteriaceae bacterium]
MQKRLLSKIKRYTLWFFGTIFTLTIAYLLAAFLLSIIPTSPHQFNCSDKYSSFITTNGVHLEIVLPVESLSSSFKELLNIPPGTQFVSFGWGDKAFFINTPSWSDLSPVIAFSALFLPSKSALHVTFYTSISNKWHEVDLCLQQLDSLNMYISGAFLKDSIGRFQQIPNAAYSYNDRFYDSTGYYTLFNTCNSWVNNALKHAEVITSLWSPFDFGVLYHLKTPGSVMP